VPSWRGLKSQINSKRDTQKCGFEILGLDPSDVGFFWPYIEMLYMGVVGFPISGILYGHVID
jgi:hypothetical protein